MKNSTRILLIGAGLVAQTTLAQVQTPASTPPAAPSPSAWDQFLNDTKNPVDWFSWGADLRLRNEYFNNALTLTTGPAIPLSLHEQDYFRYRGRIWASLMPVEDASLNVRVSAEPRTFMKPSFCATHSYNSGTEWRYGIIDTLNVKWTNAFSVPLAFVVGRQDIQFGEPMQWWLVNDGTPFDGSWTMYFDSVRATFDAKEIKTRFDLVYIRQTAFPDEHLPTIGESSENVAPGLGPKPYYATEQDEEGMILYASNKSIENMQLDAYFIYKHDERVHTDVLLNGDDANIYTLGGKVSSRVGDHWQYFVEGAYQFGEKTDPTVIYPVVLSTTERDINAYGGHARLSYLFKDKLNNQVALMGEYLSGDDPDTQGTDEMFDILWGRWPRWSEISVYSYAFETGGKIAQMNNLGRVGLNWMLNPVKKATFSASYSVLLAPEETPTRRAGAAANSFTYDGNFRGHYVQSFLKYQFNKNVSTHLWGECVWKGDYYAQRDLMTFLRAEICLTF